MLRRRRAQMLRALQSTEPTPDVNISSRLGHDLVHGQVSIGASQVALTTSCLLFGFLVFDMVRTWLKNYPDANVRQSITCVISATFSIFCAVLITQAMISCAYAGLWLRGGPWNLGMKDSAAVKISIEFFIAALFFVLLNVVCCWLRNSPGRKQKSVRELLSHLTGFSIVMAFSTFEEATEDEHQTLFWYVFCLLLAATVLACACCISNCVRRRCIGELGEVYTAVPSTEPSQDVLNSPKLLWLKFLLRSEDEAVGLCLGYLVDQLLAYALTGMIFSFERPEHLRGITTEIQHLPTFFAACVFMFLIIIVSLFRAVACSGEVSHSPELSERLINLMEVLLTFCMGWTTVRLTFLLVMDTMKDSHLVHVTTAFIVSGVSVVGIILLDVVADRFREWHERTLRKKAVLSGTPGSCQSQSEAHHFTDRDPDLPLDRDKSRSLVVVMHAETLLTPRGELDKAAVEDASIPGMPNYAHLENALRNVILGFALTTGLSWEKAVESATRIVIYGFPETRHYPVSSQLLMAVVVASIVLPVWSLYVVPEAMKDVQDHEDEILIEQELSHRSLDHKASATKGALMLQIRRVIEQTSNDDLPFLKEWLESRPQHARSAEMD